MTEYNPLLVREVASLDPVSFVGLVFGLMMPFSRPSRDSLIAVDFAVLRGHRVVVPEFLRTLVFARPRGDDQFADCTFSPSLDMSR